MATRKWTTSAIHRLTLLIYPSGDSSLSVQTRDLPTLGVASSKFVGFEADREGVYYTQDGKWVWQRELGVKSKAKERKTEDRTEYVSEAILEALEIKGRLRAKDLAAACCGEALPDRTFHRHLKRLTRMGAVSRFEDKSHGGKGRCVYYTRVSNVTPRAQ